MSQLSQIEAFLREHDMPASTFGKLACGDPRIFGDFRRGRVITEMMSYRIDAFMTAFRNSEEWIREKADRAGPPMAGRTDPSLESLHQQRAHESAMRHFSNDLLAALWRVHPGIMTIRQAVRS